MTGSDPKWQDKAGVALAVLPRFPHRNRASAWVTEAGMGMPTRAELPLQVAAAVARVFGVVTIVVAGMMLYGGDAVQPGVGDVVPFILWFNLGAGFASVVAGFGLAWRRRWGLVLALAIVAAIAVAAGGFAWYVARGGDDEVRTVYELALRLAVWLAIAAVAWRAPLY